MGHTNGLLLDERVVAVQPSLVRAIGLTKAVVLQQLHWHLGAAGHGREHAGEVWFPITQTVLAEETGLTAQVVRRALEALEQEGIVLSIQPEGRQSRRKWYRIDLAHDRFVQVAKPPDGKGRNRPMGKGETAPSSSSKTMEEVVQERESAATPLATVVEIVEHRQRTERDRLFDALVEAFGPASPTRASSYGKAVSELLAMGATPEQVIAKTKALRDKDWDTPTEHALLKHWYTLGQPGPRKRTAIESRYEKEQTNAQRSGVRGVLPARESLPDARRGGQ